VQIFLNSQTSDYTALSMGKARILLFMLGACIAGIAISARMIAVQSDTSGEYRQLLYVELEKLAAEAQAYHNRRFEDDGGDDTFIGLTSTPYGIARLTKNPRTPFGEFFISKSGNVHDVQITAIGNSPGNDRRKPIKMLMTIFAERSAIAVIN
jgi:hypothetical protein